MPSGIQSPHDVNTNRGGAGRVTTPQTTPIALSQLDRCTASVLEDPGRYALFLDVDGTLLELAATPKSVHVPNGLIGTLQRLSLALDGAVAVVTGRLISEIDLLLAPLKLAASGVHGAELRLS